MRVVMFDPGNFIPYYIDALSCSLALAGADVSVITSPPLFGQTVTSDAYRSECLFFPFLQGRRRDCVRYRRTLRRCLKAAAYPAGVVRSWRALSARPPGVLHVQFSLAPALDARLARAMKRRGWVVAYTIHDPLPRPRRFGASRIALLEVADALVVHSRHEAESVVARYPFAGPRLSVVPHGAAVLPAPSAADRAAARAWLGIDVERPVLLFFGMLKPYKGLEYLAGAMPRVLAKFPRTLLVVAGEPFMSLEPLRAQLCRLGLADAVLLRPAFVPDADVPRYFHAADMLVAPYIDGGASGVVALAQGYGCPAVVTRVGALTEFVEPDQCGLAVPPASSEALAEAICRALGDRETLAEMGRRARQRLARVNAWTDVARRTLDVYAAAGAR
jgi:glycosyltransferase involved in cell wall biosynthesis